MIYKNYKNQPIGEMVNGIFTKHVNHKKHFMRIYQGYGISTTVFQRLKEDGCNEIVIYADNDIFRILYADFDDHKISATFDDPQVFCALKWFERKNDKQKTLL